MGVKASPSLVACLGAKTIGLSEKSLATLQSAFETYPEIRKVTLYGSRAKGNFREGSDLDLALDAPTLEFQQLLAIRTLLEDSLIPQKVDLALENDISNPDLLSHIKRVGKVMFTRVS